MTSEAFPSRIVQRLVILALVALAAGLYLRQSAETRRMRDENEALRRRIESLAPAAVDPSTAVEVAPVAPPQEPAADVAAGAVEIPATPPAVDPTLVLTPTGLAAPPRDDGLALAGTEAAEVTGGIRAVMKFTPTVTDPIGIVAVVVRLPVDGSARILDIQPAGSLRFAEVAKRVAEDGKFAIYQMQADVVEELAFELTVSEPVIAEVRGTSGIGAFDFTIRPGSAIATVK